MLFRLFCCFPMTVLDKICEYETIVQGVISELALVDMVENKLKGEMMDLQHGQAFLRTVKVVASTGQSCLIRYLVLSLNVLYAFRFFAIKFIMFVIFLSGFS